MKTTYKLNHGEALKESVERKERDRLELLDNLERCWQEIDEHCEDVLPEEDLQLELRRIETQRDYVENQKEIGLSNEYIDFNIDNLLTRFYQFCEDMNISVEVAHWEKIRIKPEHFIIASSHSIKN